MYIEKLTLELVRGVDKDVDGKEYPCFNISLNINGETSDMNSESMVEIVNGFCKNLIDLEIQTGNLDN